MVPKVSVIIPTYNRAHLIDQTIQSVLNQTYKYYDIIVIDDGSTDDTKKILSKYENHIQYLYQKNSGQGAARNLGIHTSKAEYIALIDDDDLWLPQKLERQMDILIRTKVPWIYCDCEYFNNDTGKVMFKNSQRAKICSGYIAKELFFSDFIPSPTPIIKKTLFNEMGYFEENRNFDYGEDWLVWLRIASKYPISYVPTVLAKYRVDKASLSNFQKIEIINKSHLSVLKLVKDLFPDVYKPYYKKAKSFQHLRMGKSLCSQNNFKKARGFIKTSLRYNPLNLKIYIFYFGTFGGTTLYFFWIKIRRLFEIFFYRIFNNGHK